MTWIIFGIVFIVLLIESPVYTPCPDFKVTYYLMDDQVIVEANGMVAIMRPEDLDEFFSDYSGCGCDEKIQELKQDIRTSVYQ